MFVVKDALERAGTLDPEKVRDAFASTNLTTGITQMYSAKVHFDSTGTFPDTSSMVLVQYLKVGGKLQRVTVGPQEQARVGQKLIFPYDY